MMTNKIKKQPVDNRMIDKKPAHNVFYYPAYQGPSGVYPGSAGKESRSWIAACLLLCLAIVAAGVCGGLVFRFGQKELLGSEKNPAGIGQAFFMESREQVGSSDRMAECRSRITLTQAVRGDAAAKIIANLPGADKPPLLGENQEYYIAKFKIELLESDAPHGIQYSSIFFDAMNQHDEKYVEWMDDIAGNFPVADTGESSEGMIVFVVEKDDDPIILYKAAEDRYYYFRPGI